MLDSLPRDLWPLVTIPYPTRASRRLAPISMKNSVPALRAERGWSQGELAERLGISRQTVNAVERGRYEPSLSLALAIAELFGRSVEEIFEA